MPGRLNKPATRKCVPAVSPIKLFTVRQAAAVLGITRQRGYELIRVPGGLRAIRLGKKTFRITEYELRRFALFGIMSEAE
jgi:excisionase family DNA binding protein